MVFQDIIDFLIRHDILWSVIILISSIALGRILEFVITKIIKQFTKRTKTSLDDAIVHAIEPVIFWGVIILGLYISITSVNYMVAYITTIKKVFTVIIFIWVIYLAVRLTGNIFNWYASEAKKKHDSSGERYPKIFKIIIQITITVIIFIIMLRYLGVEITPLVASLGIGGLAVALALQDTLSNLFSGFYISSDKTVRIGDYVEIEPTASNPINGYVEDINWRTIKIKTTRNNIIVVPNSKFAQSIITNYEKPEQYMQIIIPVGVSYNSDLEKVEKITVEVMKEIEKTVPGGVKDFNPFIRFNEFSDSNINFNATFRINKYTDQYLIRHEFIKALKKRYDEEGIEIAYPTRTVYMKNEKETF
ncbi:MAG: mechanosensitive ion channel family protein [Candidatus Woesearchaeota archaeon]